MDILLLLDGEIDVAREIIRAEEVKWPLSLKMGYTISLLPVSLVYYRSSGEPFVQNIRREGVAVA